MRARVFVASYYDRNVVAAPLKRLASAAIGTSAVLALSRRGFIREETDGLWVATELGLLVLAYAEAGGLLDDRRVQQ